ncbi:hypothetical protein CERSUDRAFT_117369 [Gelatoporia subvermispora B]|uniref:Uncharacterized protein n=1 Tax=Ceriporiopsis subvermispora (strain B) TaxID=914234 RepID=M2PF45_CERS8|nr:hypothetical protein CERSUDRAFT_117369 [Gelatoporia subvermispora B]
MAPAGHSVQTATASTRDPRLRLSSLRTTRIGLPRRLSYQCCSSLPQTPLNDASNEVPCEYRGLGSPAMISVARVHPISDKGTQSGNTPRSRLSTPIGTLQVESNTATYFSLPALNKEPCTTGA